MKAFTCGDVVPGCNARFLCSNDEQLLAEVGLHARKDHGMERIPDALVAQVRAHIVTVSG